jgi:hypothetical protein
LGFYGNWRVESGDIDEMTESWVNVPVCDRNYKKIGNRVKKWLWLLYNEKRRMSQKTDKKPGINEDIAENLFATEND